MNSYFLKIIDYVIQISFVEATGSSVEHVLKTYYKDYLVSEAVRPALYIEVRSRYLFKTMNVGRATYMSLYYKEAPNKIITSKSLNNIQSHFFLKTIIYNFLLEKGIPLLHSSACLINGMAVIFTGTNNAGKSTIVKMLKDTFTPLCDDMSALKLDKEGKLYLYQVPYLEKNRYKKGNIAYPVGNIYFLQKAKKTIIKNIELFKEPKYFGHIYEQVSIGLKKNASLKYIPIFRKKAYELCFSKSDNLTLKKILPSHVS